MSDCGVPTYRAPDGTRSDVSWSAFPYYQVDSDRDSRECISVNECTCCFPPVRFSIQGDLTVNKKGLLISPLLAHSSFPFDFHYEADKEIPNNCINRVSVGEQVTEYSADKTRLYGRVFFWCGALLESTHSETTWTTLTWYCCGT